jgi:hypothetical protein
MAVESARKLHRNPPPEMPRRKLYLLTILRLTLLTAFGLFVAKDVGLILFRPWSPALI